jgi:hypothetical protein
MKPKWLRDMEWACRFRASADGFDASERPSDVHPDLWQAMKDSHRSEAERLEKAAIQNVRDTVRIALVAGVACGLLLAELFHWAYS